MKYKSNHIRIGIDCRDLSIAKTGSRTYLVELINAFKEAAPNDITLIELNPFLPVIRIKGKIGKILKHLQFIYWKQFSLPLLARRKSCDILICTDYFLPLLKGRLKHLVVFHDAFFWEYPHHYNEFWLKLFQHWAVPAAEKADCVIVPSNHVKAKLEKLLNTSPSKIKVVYEAPKTFIFGRQEKNISGIHDRKPYLLHVGVLSKHKNLPFLIEAFGKATSFNYSNWHLILVGAAPGSYHDNDADAIENKIVALGLKHRVHLMGYLSDASLTGYYANASGYVFPSYNEGFGLPILEAMRFQLPLAAANNSSLPEIGKDGAIYFDPFNISELSIAIQKIMAGDPAIVDAVQRQPQVLASYSWQQAALEIAAICRAIPIER